MENSDRSTLSVGEVAKRSGLPVSTLHFYEAKGLIASERTAGNQRRYPRHMLRRLAVIGIAQHVGISLAEIRKELAGLPLDRSPTLAEWDALSRSWHEGLQRRIKVLSALRDQLGRCIGCGCLSLGECPLRNPADELAGNGKGAILLQRSLGDTENTRV